MIEFVRRGDYEKAEKDRLDKIITEGFVKFGHGRQGLRAVARLLVKLGYEDDKSAACVAVHLSELQHRSFEDRRGRAADVSRVRNAFEAARKRPIPAQREATASH